VEIHAFSIKRVAKVAKEKIVYILKERFLKSKRKAGFSNVTGLYS